MSGENRLDDRLDDLSGDSVSNAACKKRSALFYMELYPEKKVLLNMQYRMNEILMEFPNLEFYNGELKCYDKVKNISLNC